MTHPPRVSDSIMVDEIGIEFGRYQDFILKTAYQPVFRMAGGFLRPFAVEGFVVPFRQGKRVPVARLFENWRPGDEAFIERMCRLLHLRNFRNVGADGLRLVFGFDPRVDGPFETVALEIKALAERDGDRSIGRNDLICRIAETVTQEPVLLTETAARIRRAGVGLAIDDFGVGNSEPERVQALRPELVRIDGKWFQKLADRPETLRLFAPLVAGLQAMDTKVLVSGIEMPHQFSICMDAGVDYVQGHLFGEPELAGAVIDERPRPVSRFLRRNDGIESDAKVVRLFRR
ncbi:MAG: EAL domain-containing protein [Rhizobiaceae bacterium]|nr:MAG: EAL domain-containing protein [Rhizobiaceae bacterium]